MTLPLNVDEPGIVTALTRAKVQMKIKKDFLPKILAVSTFFFQKYFRYLRLSVVKNFTFIFSYNFFNFSLVDSQMLSGHVFFCFKMQFCFYFFDVLLAKNDV